MKKNFFWIYFIKQMSKIGIYGGSFNPIHWGHIGVAKYVLEHTDLDEVWLMVSPANPLKDKHILADEMQRFALAQQQIQAMISHETQFAQRILVSDFELHLPRPSYMYNTLSQLVQAYPMHTFSLIIGEDNLYIFTQWKNWQEILQTPVYIYPRNNQNPQAALQAIETLQKSVPQADITYFVDAPLLHISSTQIREQKTKI